jgi:hypothetical protein
VRLLVGGVYIDGLTPALEGRLVAAEKVVVQAHELVRAWVFKPTARKVRDERFDRAIPIFAQLPSGGRLAAAVTAARHGRAWATPERVDADVTLFEHAAQRFAFASKRFLVEVRRRKPKAAGFHAGFIEELEAAMHKIHGKP